MITNVAGSLGWTPKSIVDRATLTTRASAHPMTSPTATIAMP